jgi:argininosuccinate lyase
LLADLEGSIAWAKALERAKVLTSVERERMTRALVRLHEAAEEDPSEAMHAADEDVHSFVERKLGEQVGDLAKKLHTGRSRNDQVATDLRLWLREATHELGHALVELMKALVDLAGRYAADPIPGYTHGQRAQPITIGHHVLAYVEMLARDLSRLDEARSRLSQSPLGSGALAGTAYPIDRERLAKDLGLEGGPTRNSLDAVGSRDHVAEVAFVCAQALVHLSRLCEDWIFYASYEARFLELSDAVSTGSSLMPQKKNPDALELIRGKSARVLGHLQALLVLQKGLPLAYDKDLQEDKEALFDALITTTECCEVMATVARNVGFDRERCRREAGRGYLNATDLADLLVRDGVPFRTAHERVGAAVKRALELGVELEDLPEDERARLVPELEGSLADLLGVDAVLARRDVLGGTAPRRVKEQVRTWRKALGT